MVRASHLIVRKRRHSTKLAVPGARMTCKALFGYLVILGGLEGLGGLGGLGDIGNVGRLLVALC